MAARKFLKVSGFSKNALSKDSLSKPSRLNLSILNLSLRRLRAEDGDVPGWVLITLMTAGLVIIIWAIAGPALSDVFQQAIDRVTGF